MVYTIYGLIILGTLLVAYGIVQFNVAKPDEDFRKTEASSILFSLFKPLIQILGIYNQRICSDKLEEKYQQKLLTSGNPFNLIPTEFIAVKELASVGGFLFGIFLMFSVNATWLLVTFITLFCYILPDITLTQAIRERKKQIFRDLPYVMDLLALSMEAGLGFTLAIEKVVQKGSKSELNREFSRLLRDIKMGLTMRDALLGLATRTDMYEIRTFSTALIQADILGTPLAEVLQTQAEIRRTERFQRAEKLAQEAPVKMLFPLLFFIFPAVFIAILTPIILQFMAQGM